MPSTLLEDKHDSAISRPCPCVPVSCIQCPIPASSQPLVWDWGPGQGEGQHGQEAPSTWHIFSFYGVSSPYPWLLAQLKRWPKHLFHVCYYLPYFFCRQGWSQGLLYIHLHDKIIHLLTHPFPFLTLQSRHTKTIRDSSSSYKVDYVKHV